MRVIDISGNNVLNFVLRDYSTNESYDYVLTNENNGNATTTTVAQSTAAIQANMDQFTFTLDGTAYVEGDIFSFKILDNANSVVLYRGKFFFTAQVPQNYSINE